MILLSQWLKDNGRSRVSGCRWVKVGWLKPLNIGGRLYLTLEEVREFGERAKRENFYGGKAIRPAPAIRSD